VLRGHVPQVKSPLRWKQMEELAHSINRAFMRAREGGAALAPADDKRLTALVHASAYPVIVLNSRSVIAEINDAALYVLQVPREAAERRPLMEVVTDPTISAKVNAMLQAISSGQTPMVSEPAVVSGEQRRITIAGEPAAQRDGLEFAVLVIA
jgi:PAS domain-containing protein